jgi:hypothetical protein
MASQWDHRADKALLLAIIEDGQCKSINWRIIATKMKAKNYTFTHEACRYAIKISLLTCYHIFALLPLHLLNELTIVLKYYH